LDPIPGVVCPPRPTVRPRPLASSLAGTDVRSSSSGAYWPTRCWASAPCPPGGRAPADDEMLVGRRLL
jgi:hypothetical protein